MRRSGQRSRVHKLQYIAELERTVDSLQSQTQALKNEAERLKQMSARHRRSRSVTSCYDPSPFGADAPAVNW
ncbi:hypothetical protein ACP70R_026885 [Stipagrostis hirtigluma subsp. patula]